MDAGRDGMIVSAQVGIRPLSASSCFKLLLLRTYLTTRSHSVLRSRDLMHICIPYGVLRLHLSSVFPIPSQPLCRPISLSSKFPPPGLISSCRASIPPVDHDASSHLCLTFFFSRRPTVLGKPTEGSMGRPPCGFTTSALVLLIGSVCRIPSRLRGVRRAKAPQMASSH